MGDMDSEIKSFKCKMEIIEKTVTEQRVEILKVNDLIKTKGITQTTMTAHVVEPVHKESTDTNIMSRTEMNRVTVISTLMSLKGFASETEDLLQLLTKTDEGVIKRILGMLCPLRIISSVDIEIIKTTDFSNKVSCQGLERHLQKIIPDPPQSHGPCNQAYGTITAASGAIRKKARNLLFQ